MAKKINSLLKGVAITGATIGGASILNDSTLAYAQEVEDVTLTNNSGEIFVENETVAPVEQTFVQEQVEQPAEPIQEVPSQPTQQVVELLATPVPLEGEPQAEVSQPTVQESNDVALQAGSENLDSSTEQVNSVEMTDEEIYASTSAQPLLKIQRYFLLTNLLQKVFFLLQPVCPRQYQRLIRNITLNLWHTLKMAILMLLMKSLLSLREKSRKP